MNQNKVFITRKFNHPIDLVFQALTDPNYIRSWFGPPRMTTKQALVELNQGGRYVFELEAESGPGFTIEGVYKEIDRPHKLVFTLNYVGLPHGQVGESLVTMQLSPLDGGQTELLFKQEFEVAPPGMEDRTKAWEAMFDRMELTINH